MNFYIWRHALTTQKCTTKVQNNVNSNRGRKPICYCEQICCMGL